MPKGDSPLVEVEVSGNLYLVKGFESEEEADQFVTDVGLETSSRVKVEGPF